MAFLDEMIKNSPVKVYQDRYAVLKCKSRPGPGPFMVTDDGKEITAIVKESDLEKFEYTGIEKWYILYGIRVSVPFEGPGFLARIADKLARDAINILIISTFSQDFILLREDDAEKGVRILREMGFTIFT